MNKTQLAALWHELITIATYTALTFAQKVNIQLFIYVCICTYNSVQVDRYVDRQT